MKKVFALPRVKYIPVKDDISTSTLNASNIPTGGPMVDGEVGDIREFYFYDEEEQDGWY